MENKSIAQKALEQGKGILRLHFFKPRKKTKRTK
jgi:hypothetical protein